MYLLTLTIVQYDNTVEILVGGLEHQFYFPIYWVYLIIPIDFQSYFSEGWPWPTNQIMEIYGTSIGIIPYK